MKFIHILENYRNKIKLNNLLENYKNSNNNVPSNSTLTSECLMKISHDENIKWPIVDKKYLITSKNLIVIQVNGKRSTLLVEKNLTEKELVQLIKDKELIVNYLANGELIKTIYIKDRLINFIIK